MHFADFHCDTISALYDIEKQADNSTQQTSPQTLLHNQLQVDATRLSQQHYLLQHFAIFIDMAKYDNPYETALSMLDYYHSQLDSCKGILTPVTCGNDLKKALHQQRTAAIVTIEEGGILDGDIQRLDTLFQKGVRLLTLTWNYENCIGSPSNIHYGEDIFPTVPNTTGGLTDFGREVVTRCEELGITVDVSHLSDAGFYDVYEMCTKPFVASHSSARAVCPHVRNASDDMIRKIAQKGGLIGVNFCPAFIENPFDEQSNEQQIATKTALINSPNIPTNPHMDWAPYATLEHTLRHIRHIYNAGGIDCIALGSDFDGIDRNLELDDVSCMPMLFEALKKDGYTEREIDAILFQNMIRFYKNAYCGQYLL